MPPRFLTPSPTPTPGSAPAIPDVSPAAIAALWETSILQATGIISRGLACASGAGTKGPGVTLLTLPSAAAHTTTEFFTDVAVATGDYEGYARQARTAGGGAFAVLPLHDETADDTNDDGALAVMNVGALLVVLDGVRNWSEADRLLVTSVASLLATTIELHQELAQHVLVEDELRQRALRDSLTGIPNSALFLDRLAHAIERARRHKEFRFAVLALDLDRFQSINNSLGREVGDEVLTTIARRLESCVRGEDMVARSGGDEFSILLESLSDDSDGGRVAARMLRAIAAPVETSEGEVFTSASIGIVLSSSGLDAPQRLLQQAGIAMSRAKSAGRARYEMFDGVMHAKALARLRMETDLRHALERNEFELYYQPLVTLGSGRITELEALIRWRHPRRGIVPPLDFIPVAEDTGLIVPIGSWVLAKACADMREWQQRFPRAEPLSLSVNLSPKQFAQPGFVQFVAETVTASGLDPRTLKLEITESFAIDDPERTRDYLTQLRALGIRIYLDDFGTGYSSLGQLHQLPLDGIKIDRAFVMQMEQRPVNRQLVHTVRDLAMNIGVAAVAEGVETTSQLEVLRAIGCESAQGYLFSRPVPVGEIEVLLGADPRW
ncbi:MAG TPA: bifunctional diguanylate cyclase/phosphodiesterase [Gemmatimonadaceae bacterium]|nr:bifunctional diguanylate cyclase/phosphodiesterase [Gemmatimonadaceae bacterium]